MIRFKAAAAIGPLLASFLNANSASALDDEDRGRSLIDEIRSILNDHIMVPLNTEDWELQGAELKVIKWVANLQITSKSRYKPYIGHFNGEPSVGEDKAVRVLIILPSEYCRDSASDWDSFELVLLQQKSMRPFSTQQPEAQQHEAATLLLSAENYRRRTKAIGGDDRPSPDREYYSVADNDVANARLRAIVNAIKRVAEGPRIATPGGNSR